MVALLGEADRCLDEACSASSTAAAVEGVLEPVRHTATGRGPPARRELPHARFCSALRRTRQLCPPPPQWGASRCHRGGYYRGGRAAHGRHAAQGGAVPAGRGRPAVGDRDTTGHGSRDPGPAPPCPGTLGLPVPVGVIVGRTENPVPRPDSALGQLASHLRRCRARADLTNAALAARTKYSATTLQRASGGAVLPDPTSHRVPRVPRAPPRTPNVRPARTPVRTVMRMFAQIRKMPSGRGKAPPPAGHVEAPAPVAPRRSGEDAGSSEPSWGART